MPELKQSMSDLAARAQAFLLSEGGPVSHARLGKLLKADEPAVKGALAEVAASLEGSGIALIEAEGEASLASAPRVAEPMRIAFEESLSRDIGTAGLEVLSTVLYRGPSTRARIDYIRGVNTSSTIRLLLARGLLERVPNPDDGREYLYRATAELLAHLGVRAAEELPEYGTIRDELAAFEKAQTAFDHDGNRADSTADS